MRFAVTVLFWLAFGIGSAVGFFLGALLHLATLPFDGKGRWLHRFVCRWAHAHLKLNPAWDVKVSGREHLPKGPCVLVANHQSMADIAALMGLRYDFKFVSKASLFSLPIVGWLMSMMRYVPVHRGRPQSIRQMMDDCRQWLRRGVPVLIFPEGTYGADGRLLPFKRGAFRLAIDERVPLVPVVIEGTPTLVHEDGPWLSPRCRIRVTVHPPIAPAELGDDDGQLAARVRAFYERVLGHASPQPDAVSGRRRRRRPSASR